jgi:hypothetical protein
MASNLKITELDFFQIRNNLKAYLKSQQDKGKFTDYDFDGSGMSVLIDLLAYNTHYNAVNANIAINEVFLDTAERRNNVVSHAKMLGYVPRSIVASYATVDITVNEVIGAPPTLTMDRGTQFTTTLNDTQFVFTNLEAITIAPINGVYTFEEVQLRQGELRTFSYVVDSFDTSQYFEIPDINADISTLVVKVRDNENSTASEVFTLAKNFTELNSTTNAYFIQEGMDGKYEVYFGDGIVGKKLQGANVVLLEWLSTQGGSANGCNVFNLASTIQGNDNVNILTLVKAAGGGAGEDLDSIKFNAPLSYLAQNRVVTSDDYKTIVLNSYADIETVTVWGGEENDPPQYGKVYLSIKPKSGEALSITEKQRIIDQILKSKNVVSIIPVIVDPEYTYIWLEVFFKYDPNLTDKTIGELESLVKNVVSNFNETELKKFDGVFRHSKLTRAIDTSETSILSSIIRVYMEKRLVPELNALKRYEMKFSSPFCEIGLDAPIVSSGPFTFNGFTQYIENKYEKNQPGMYTLQMYRVVNNAKIITNFNVGYMNAMTGLVVLENFAPSAFEGDAIIFKARPFSLDIAPNKNQLLQIDMTQVTVTPEVDTIATGGTSAGIGYKTVPGLPTNGY